MYFFFFSSRRRHTRSLRDWSSDVCSSDLEERRVAGEHAALGGREVLGRVETERDGVAARADRPALVRRRERSEERRVGKECRSRWSSYILKKTQVPHKRCDYVHPK